MFTPIKKTLRAWFKPGLQSFNFGLVTPNGQSSIPGYGQNTNADPACDLRGCQWIRDAGLPAVKDVDSGPNNTDTLNLGPSLWAQFINTNLFYLVPPIQLGQNVALFRVHVNAGNPAGPWSGNQVYFQIVLGSVASPPTSGVSIPLVSIPVPTPPLSLDFDLTPRTPFLSPPTGFALVLSSTRDVYTLTAATGFFNVNYSYAA